MRCTRVAADATRNPLRTCRRVITAGRRGWNVSSLDPGHIARQIRLEVDPAVPKHGEHEEIAVGFTVYGREGGKIARGMVTQSRAWRKKLGNEGTRIDHGID